MRRVGPVFFLLCLLLVFPSCASTTAAPNPPIAVTPAAPPPPRPTNTQIMADKIPGDALMAVGFRGSDNLGAEYDDSNLKGMLDATKIVAQINKYLPVLTELISAKNPQAGVSTKLLLDALPAVLKHPTAFCFRGISPAINQTPPMPIIYMICHSGEQTDAVYNQLQALIDSFPEKVPTLSLEKSASEVTLQIGQPTLVGESKNELAMVPLTHSPAFLTSMDHVQNDPVLWAYCDMPGIINLANAEITTYAPPEFQARWFRLRAALGIDGIGVIAGSEGFDGKDWQSESFTTVKGPRTGVLSLADPRPLTNEMLNLIPMKATTASAFHLDLAKVFQLVLDVTQQTDADAAKQIDAAMKQAQTTTGVDLQKDLINTFGNEWVEYGTEFHGTNFLGQTMINKMRDPKTATKSLAALEVIAQKYIDVAAGAGQTTVSMTIEHVTEGEADVTVLTVQNQKFCYTIDGDYFYMAPDPAMISDAMDHIANKGKSILKNETFLAVRKHLNVQDPLTTQYADLPTIIPEMLTTVRGLLVMVQMMGINIPADLIPSNESIQPYLTPSIGESWMDKDGWHTKAVGPFPGAG